MTRGRTDSNGLVDDMTVECYAQRASAGLLFSEAIRISEEATGSPLTPGIFTDEQIAAWRRVTTAVHDKGGVIIAQLWHTGRMRVLMLFSSQPVIKAGWFIIMIWSKVS